MSYRAPTRKMITWIAQCTNGHKRSQFKVLCETVHIVAMNTSTVVEWPVGRGWSFVFFHVMWCVEHPDDPEITVPTELTPVFWNRCKMCIKGIYFTLWSLKVKMHAGVLCLNMVCGNSSCKKPSDKWHLHSAHNTHIWLNVTNRQKQDHTGVKCSKFCWIFHDSNGHCLSK